MEHIEQEFENQVAQFNEQVLDIFNRTIARVINRATLFSSDNSKKRSSRHPHRNISSSELKCECGTNGNKNVMSVKIVGGQDAPPRKFPWMVGLWLKSYFGFLTTFRCGASLINDYFVITAGHCVDGLSPGEILLTFGNENYCERSLKDTTVRGVKSIFVPKVFNEQIGSGDVALLRLEREIYFTDQITPICLPKDSRNSYNDIKATIAGWGQVNQFVPSSTSCQLRFAEIRTYSNEQCRHQSRYNPKLILNSMICAGDLEGGNDTCQGDSGGPLMYRRNDGTYEIIGVVSRGVGCGNPGFLGLYTRVTSYMDWIKRTTKDSSAFCRN